MSSKNKIFNSDDESEDEGLNLDTEHKEDVQDNLVIESGDDSDAAPDDVTFEAGRTQVLSKVKDALQQISREKEKLRTKRRQKDVQFKTQKIQKMSDSENRRLPDDILDRLTDKPIKTKTDKKVKAEQTDKEKAETEQDVLVDDLLGSSGSEDEESFIPLEESAVRAVCVDEVIKSSMSSAEKAADFRNQRLYGGHVRREAMKDKLAKKIKRKARFL